MKRMLLMLLLTSVGFLQANAQQVVFDENAEIRTVGDFTGLDVSGSITVYLAQGQVNAVAISAGDPKYNSKIKTEVRNGVLKISVDGGMWNGMGWANRKLRAYVTIARATSLEVSGASLVSISETLKADDLKIDVSGASEIKGTIEANTISVDISGASVTRLAGKVKDLSIDASGACKFGGYEFATDNARLQCSGASAIRLTINGSLNASASGGAHVYYKGNPDRVNINQQRRIKYQKAVGRRLSR